MFNFCGNGTRRRAPLLVLTAIAIGGCSGPSLRRDTSPPPEVASSPPGASTATATKPFPPLELLWFRTSAERQAAYAQAFRYAWDLVENTSKGPDAWAVVIDADETILDNSPYQERYVRLPSPPSAEQDEELWTDWVREEKAAAFAPAVEFLDRIRASGGHIVVVSNRVESTCDATRRNLTSEKVPFDAVLCAPSWANTAKQPRFDAVTNGRAVPSVGPLVTVLYIGDNIKDCPRQTQTSFDPELFGKRCIVLPNPMYGSWESNEYR